MEHPAGTVHAAVVGDVLLVHGETEPYAALTGVAARLPDDRGRTVVLCSPTVSGRPDLFGVLADLLPRHLGGSAVGFRLVPLGGYADPVAVPGLAAGLATDLGIDAAVPLDAPAMSTRAVPTARRWVVADGGPVRPEDPPPGWAIPDRPRPTGDPGSTPDGVPVLAAPVDGGPAGGGGDEGWRVIPVGAGYTWLPGPTATTGPGADRPEQHVPAASPQVPFPPVPAASGARPSLPAVVASREQLPLPAVVASTPGRAVPGGWSFLDPPEPGRSGPAPLDVFLVEVAIGAGGFRVDGCPVPPGVLAGHLAAVRIDGRPVVLRGSAPYPVAAGMLFGSLADALGRPVVASDSRVTVTATGLLSTPGTFRRWCPQTTAGAARVVTDLGPVLPTRPRVPVPATVAPDPPGVAGMGTPGVLLVGRSASAVDPPFVVSDGAQGWPQPAVPGLDLLRVASPEVEPVERAVASGVESTPAGASGATGTDPEAGLPDRAGAATGSAGAVSGQTGASSGPESALSGATGTPPGPAGDPSGPVSGALPVATDAPPGPDGPVTPSPGPQRVPVPFRPEGGAPAAGDRMALRRILAGRYDSYTQVVTRTLAEEPGLRVAAMGAPDLPAGLVAVRAYCTGEREAVNAVLRGDDDPGPDADPTVLARWVAYGLRRLPVVFGPVFRATTVLPAVGYRPGTVLVEPAFLDVDPAPAPAPDAAAEFVIWSTGARRLGGLAAGPRTSPAGAGPVGARAVPRTDGAAVFPAGTCFEVLAEEQVDDRELRRVFLRELPAGRSTGGGEQTLARLRAVVAAGTGAGGGTAPLTVGLGFDGMGRLFALPPG
ncbi:hypothetical protein ABZ436_21075 [Micromonospora matsumotoense]|uniref:hypothetical protein n=1 Tax=Micromonospora matsumotoense TaxID=121616 RepID=UPI0033D81149